MMLSKISDPGMVERRPVKVTCFLDESATNGSSPFAVVGGLLIDEVGHGFFLRDWKLLLDKFQLWPSLHMKDFASERRLGGRSLSDRSAIFSMAVEIINAYKIYSLSCCLPNEVFKAAMSDKAKKYHSQYQICFLMAALRNGDMAAYNNYLEPVSLVMDRGNPDAEHIRRGHQEMKKIPREEGVPKNLGDLCFDDDEKELALQAADVICWGARRKASGTPFRVEHAPIANMLADERAHIPVDLLEEGVRNVAAYFGGGPIKRKGRPTVAFGS